MYILNTLYKAKLFDYFDLKTYLKSVLFNGHNSLLEIKYLKGNF